MADREADLGADLQELQANRLTLSASQGGLLQSETTQGVHEHVGGGGQIQPELIGAHRCRAGPVGEQTQLLFFYGPCCMDHPEVNRPGISGDSIS